MVHHVVKGEMQLVALDGLFVLIKKEGDIFTAQGVQVDYMACGETEDEVKKNFAEGLMDTAGVHLHKYGHIENLLVTADPAVSSEYIVAKAQHMLSAVQPYKVKSPAPKAVKELTLQFATKSQGE